MPSSSNPPAANVPPRPKSLRPELESLISALAALPEPERLAVFAAANDLAQPPRQRPSWGDWESARDVVKLGGNAVEDCDGSTKAREAVLDANVIAAWLDEADVLAARLRDEGAGLVLIDVTVMDSAIRNLRSQSIVRPSDHSLRASGGDDGSAPTIEKSSAQRRRAWTRSF